MSTTAPTADAFSTPVFLEGDAAASGLGGAVGGLGGFTQAQSSPADLSSTDVVVDLNDPNLLMSEMDTNYETNAYAMPAPVPDSFYEVKLRPLKVKDAKGQEAPFAAKQAKNGQVYAYVAVEGEIIDPSGKYEGRKIRDNFLSTLPSNNGGVPIVRVLKCLGVTLPAKVTAKSLIDSLLTALAAEPILTVETVWEGQVEQDVRQQFEAAGEKAPRPMGMHRFPAVMGKPGEHVPEMTLETKFGKVGVRANARINGYYKKGARNRNDQ